MTVKKTDFGFDKWLPATNNSYIRFGKDGTIQTAMKKTPQSFMDDLHAKRNDGTNGWMPARKMRRTARVTPTIIRMWEIQDGVNFQKMHPEDKDRYVRRKLNDPDWNKLKICSGRV